MGCYLKIPVTNKPVTKNVLVTKGGMKTSDKFDPNTGEENEFRTIIVNETVYPSPYIQDRQDLDYDEFTKPAYAGVDDEEYSLFIPNRCDENLLKGETSYDFELPLGQINSETQIIRFKRKYSKYLDYYTEKYGKYEVIFGIVRHGS